jgi:hypothetical protein
LAIAALVLWMCTASAGGYLLATGVRAKHAAASSEQDPAPARTAAQATAPPKPVRPKDRFDPPSLRRAKAEPLPGMRALAEFAHPALAIAGLGFWLGYVLTRDRVFAAIGLGVLLGTICAGLTWFAANTRAARRARSDALPLSPRLLGLHAAGAALTLLLVALTVVVR